MSTPYRPRWPVLLTLVGGVALLIALASLLSEPAGEARPVRGGSYVEGVAGAPSRINPLFAAFNEVDQDLTSLIFSGLMRLGPKGNVQPDLAERWILSPDGLIYSFQLRRGLSWHDGEALDANDVLFTIRAIQDPDFRGDPVLAELFRDVQLEAPDAYTVVMTLPQPFAPFLAYTTLGILPEHLLGELDAAGLYATRFNQRPIGSGPFRLVDLRTDRATLKSNDDYHLGAPLLETVELLFYHDDAALMTALRAEEVDGALLRPGLNPEDLAFIDSESRWDRRSLHTTTYSLVYLNPRVPAFEDVEVRRALQHGLDREALITAVLAGQALPVDSPIMRDLWAYVSDPDAYAFDLVRAEALLDDAGWLRTKEGREREGVPLQFTLATSDDPTQSRVAQEIARQWGELGIQVDVQASGVSQFTEEVLLPRQFDAALRTISPPGPDPDPYPFWHSTQALDKGLNLANFSNRDADRLLENARLTPSVGERAEEYRAFQEIFAQELPAILLSTPTYQYVVRSDVQGMSPGLLFDLSSRFYDVHRWSLESEAPSDDGE